MDPVAEKLKKNEPVVHSLREFDSSKVFWNGVKVWVGNNEYEPPHNGYHFIVDTPEGYKFSFDLRVENGVPIVEQTWSE